MSSGFLQYPFPFCGKKGGGCPFPNAADSPLARRYADVGAVACGEKKCFLLRTEKSSASFFLKNAVIG